MGEEIKSEDMACEAKNPLTCKAAIESRFNFGQTVWFIDQSHICHGEVLAIKGESTDSGHKDVQLRVRVRYGQLGCDMWVDERYVFESSKQILAHLVNSI